ncbi:MAG: hypothetical protein RLZZ267_20, partial [Bacillota bacterium]
KNATITKIGNYSVLRLTHMKFPKNQGLFPPRIPKNLENSKMRAGIRLAFRGSRIKVLLRHLL